MAHLLGSHFCIDSLSQDILQLNEVNANLITRVGKINSFSWKYPDKIACELDVSYLLANYRYQHGENELNQISHIILLELIIDRFSLLIQLVTELVDKLIQDNSKLNGPSSSSSPASFSTDRNSTTQSCSIGIVVKKFSNKSTQLHYAIRTLRENAANLQTQLDSLKKLGQHDQPTRSLTDSNEVSRKSLNGVKFKRSNESHTSANSDQNRASVQTGSFAEQALQFLDEIDRNTNNEIKEDNEIPKNTSIQRTINQSASSSASSASSRVARKDCALKSCQTVETAFMPCDSCNVSQDILKDLNNFLQKVLDDQSLFQSSKVITNPTKANLAAIEGWLSDKQLIQWRTVIHKDLTRLGKLLADLRNERNRLVDNLTESENSRQVMHQQLDEMRQQLNEVESATREQLSSIQKLHADEQRKSSEKLDELQTQFTNKAKQLEQLNKQRETLSSQIQTQTVAVEQLNSVLKKINVNDVEQFTEKWEKLDKTNSDLSQEVAQLRGEIARLQILVESNDSRNQNLEGKEEKLLNRIRELTEKSTEEERRADQWEDEAEELRGTIDKMKRETVELEMKLQEQRLLSKSLEDKLLENSSNVALSSKNENKHEKEEFDSLHAEIAKLRDTNKMLVQYPDCNGPVNSNLQSSDDILYDMQCQRKANQLRIDLLIQENKDLERTLTQIQNKGLKLTTPNTVKSQRTETTTETERRTREEHVNADGNQQNHQQQPRLDLPHPSSRSSLKSVPVNSIASDARPSLQYNNSKTHTNVQRKSSATRTPINNENGGGVVRWTTGSSGSAQSGRNSRANKIFTCAQCGKVCKAELDLQVHKQYCRAGVGSATRPTSATSGFTNKK